MKLDHIGYLTSDIDASAKAFADLGFIKGKTFRDDIQKCLINLIRKDNEVIELVQPFEENFPMNKMLKKRGVTPYHLCYVVNDVQLLYDNLSKKDGWTPLFPPVKAIAFNNRLITYFLNAETGFVEFVNAG